MNIAMKCVPKERPEDPGWMIPASPLDVAILQGPIEKDRREDLQILSFAAMLAATGGGGGPHPVEIQCGEDPPDRVVVAGGIRHAVELTELTVSDARVDLARARAIAPKLRALLLSKRQKFTHLIGRRVVASVMPKLDKSVESPNVEELGAMLEKDVGYVGQDVDASDVFEKPWTSERGFYGQHGTVVLTVFPDGIPGDFFVISSGQAEIGLRDTLEALEQRIRAKDIQGNDVLLITCCLPDSRGFVCPVDEFMFRLIKEDAKGFAPKPTHLKSVLLHLWGTPEWALLYRHPDVRLAWP